MDHPLTLNGKEFISLTSLPVCLSACCLPAVSLSKSMSFVGWAISSQNKAVFDFFFFLFSQSSSSLFRIFILLLLRRRRRRRQMQEG